MIVTLAAGCTDSDEIRSFNVPKQKTVAATAQPQASSPTDRMLTAIFPIGDQAWFFKVVGPVSTVKKHEDAINKFFSNLATGAGGQPKWTLPEGWTEKPGTPPRLATITIPDDSKPLELTVNALGWRGTQDEMLSNVNRWRGQLGLAPIGAEQLSGAVRETKAGEQTVSIVDLEGRFQAGAMTPPFAGGAFVGPPPVADATLPAGHPPIDGTPTDETAVPGDATLPPGHPPIDDAPANEAPAEGTAHVPKFDVPSTWKQIPASGMRKAAFDVSDGDKEALVTLIDFNANAGPLIADPRTNVNRWRKEVGLPDVDEQAFASVVETVDVDGHPVTLAVIIPDSAKAEQSQADLATIGAMVTVGDRIWFLKMFGDRDVVAAQQDAFMSFLKSMQFPK